VANLGNVGKTFKAAKFQAAVSVYDQAKEPTSVTMHVVSAFHGITAFLYHGIVNTPTTGGAGGFTKSDSSGNIYFYDMEDSGSTPYYIYTLGAGEDWSVTVVGAVVTVTQLHTANKAISVAGCA
jgi:hypothetical protein